MYLQTNYHRRLLLYDDESPYSSASSPPPPPPSGHSSSLPSLSSITTSRHTLRQPPPVNRGPLAPDPPFESSVALTILILLGALFFLGFFSIYIRCFAAVDESSATVRRQRRPPAPPRMPMSSRSSCSTTRKGVDAAIIRSLPSYGYDGCAKYQIDCPVCLSQFEQGEPVKAIPYCAHVFHVQCIDRWLQSHVSCPVCRATQLLVLRPYVAEPTVGHCSTTPEDVRTSRSAAIRTDTCGNSGERGAASTAVARCNSCSRLEGGETPGDRRALLYRTLSF